MEYSALLVQVFRSKVARFAVMHNVGLLIQRNGEWNDVQGALKVVGSATSPPKAQGPPFAGRYPRMTLLRYDFQTRISVCIRPLFIFTSTHTLLFLFLHKISQYECQQDGRGAESKASTPKATITIPRHISCLTRTNSHFLFTYLAPTNISPTKSYTEIGCRSRQLCIFVQVVSSPYVPRSHYRKRLQLTSCFSLVDHPNVMQDL